MGGSAAVLGGGGGGTDVAWADRRRWHCTLSDAVRVKTHSFRGNTFLDVCCSKSMCLCLGLETGGVAWRRGRDSPDTLLQLNSPGGCPKGNHPPQKTTARKKGKVDPKKKPKSYPVHTNVAGNFQGFIWGRLIPLGHHLGPQKMIIFPSGLRVMCELVQIEIFHDLKIMN